MFIYAVDVKANGHQDRIRVIEDEKISQMKAKIEQIRGKSLTNYVMIWNNQKLIEWQTVSYYNIPPSSKIWYLPADMHDNLNIIAAKAKEADEARIKLIDKLEIFARDWENTHNECQKAKIAGSSLGIIGGVLTIGGGIATVLTGGIAAPFLIGGGALVGAAGGTTSIVSSIIDSVKTKDTYKRVNEALQDFQKKFDKLHEVAEPTRKWLKFSLMNSAAKIALMSNVFTGAWKGKKFFMWRLMIAAIGLATNIDDTETTKTIIAGLLMGETVIEIMGDMKTMKEARELIRGTTPTAATKGATKVIRNVGVLTAVFLVTDIIDLVSVVQDEAQFANELRKLANELKQADKST